jgi:hypothetical protein
MVGIEKKYQYSKKLRKRYMCDRMTAYILSKNMNKVLVIGPIYDKIEKLSNVSNMVSSYDQIIFNGGLCYPYANPLEVKDRLAQMDKLTKTKKVIYNIDAHDLMCAKECYTKKEYTNIVNWIWSKPNVIIINFIKQQTTTIITGGGISLKMNHHSLTDNLETSFISKINGISWHQLYGGMSGYIISNNPLTLKPPQFHRFSAQIGNVYGPETRVYAQELDGLGLKNTILL